MHIRISVVQPDPPVGTAALEGGEPRPFEGWLGLLGALSELLGERGVARTRHNTGDEAELQPTTWAEGEHL